MPCLFFGKPTHVGSLGSYVLEIQVIQRSPKDDEESPNSSDPFCRSDIFPLFPFSSFQRKLESYYTNLQIHYFTGHSEESEGQRRISQQFRPLLPVGHFPLISIFVIPAKAGILLPGITKLRSRIKSGMTKIIAWMTRK